MEVISFLLALAIAIFMLVALGKIFAKAGRNPWLVLIPVYNAIVLLQIAGFSGWYILLFLVPGVGGIVVAIMQCVGLASKFGKGAGYTLGLFFLPIIFVPILGFGDAQYGADTMPIAEDPGQTPPQQ